MSERRKIALGYRRGDGLATTRTILPLGLFFWGRGWSLAAWCELRDGFRNFRLDRIDSVEVSDERFAPREGRTLRDFFLHQESEIERPT